MKHVEYKLPAEWICKEQQQHPGEENHKQIDIKLCREKQKTNMSYIRISVMWCLSVIRKHVCVHLTAQRLDGVLGFCTGIDLEARLLAEQADANGGFIVPLT